MKSPSRIRKGKAFSSGAIQTNATKLQMEPDEKVNNTFIDAYSKANSNLSDSQELGLGERKRNSLVERRYAIRRTMLNSRGLMSIATPVHENERSNSFVFAVANETASQQIGYNSDLETARETCLLCSPEQLPPKSAIKKDARGALSGKAKSEHSTVTFLYK